ncbi:pqqE domain protein [Mycobacterium kansasii 662]|uniref:PqqE domain protein n=1 Tax=Mycobacterium kansasii 662 TaxID=1299326 RepID=X7XU63_MYCKA|nr:pqqE domain protein [Mycobacterium kansasii 662]
MLCRTWRGGFGETGAAKISVVVTRHNVGQLDEFAALASRYGAPCGSPAAPVGAGRRCLGRPAPHGAQQVQLYDWLVLNGERVLTGDSFFHLLPLGESGALAVSTCAAPVGWSA